MPRNLSVLIVEDDDPLRSVLDELLRRWGCTVYATGVGEQAIEFVRRAPIDFSILDMHLPGMSGVDVFCTIRREVGVLPAILISGGATPEEARRARELGMFEFLRKPLDMATLRQSFDELVARYFQQPPPDYPPFLPNSKPTPPGS